MTFVKAKYLVALNKYAAGNDKSRDYLSGVCLDVREASKAFIVATDGHKMLISPVKNDSIALGQYIIPRALIDNIKVKRNDNTEVEIIIDGLDVTLKYGYAHFTSKLIDYSYPDWTRAIPCEQNGEPARFTGSSLKDMGDAAKLVGAANPLIGFNGWNASWVEFPNSEMFGIVMPRIEKATPNPVKPNWLN